VAPCTLVLFAFNSYYNELRSREFSPITEASIEQRDQIAAEIPDFDGVFVTCPHSIQGDQEITIYLATF
jgi:hypothetical protein